MDILNSIPILTKEKPVVAVTLKDIQAIHSSLTLDNPLTFEIFLIKRPDIVLDERNVYLEIIKRLRDNEKIRYETAMESMITADL
jgi:hypothetical protein